MTRGLGCRRGLGGSPSLALPGRCRGEFGSEACVVVEAGTRQAEEAFVAGEMETRKGAGVGWGGVGKETSS